MNVLLEAISYLEQGWCRSRLIKREDGDKFCALGAIAAVEQGVAIKTMLDLCPEDQTKVENQLYETLSESAAVKVLAKEITGRDLDEGEDAAWVVYQFNDRQDEVEPVLAMFRKAAVHLEV